MTTARPKAAAALARAELSDDDLRALHRWMVFIRVVDTRMVNLQRQGRIHFYGPITGQEAGTVGSAYATRPEDWIFPAFREAGAALVRGLPLRDYVAQCFGSSLDRAKGRQMPCHLVDAPRHYYAMSSCVGSQIPHAVGCAFALKNRRDPGVAVAYLGDGATSEGDFHVAMNFAGVWKVPCVFFCQNNQWAITVPYRLQTATETIAEKAQAYGIEAVRCDGNDVADVFEKTRDALEKARAGGGPTLVEAVTYRILGHTKSDDPSRYRDEAEVAPWRARDPIRLLEARLRERGVLGPDDPAHDPVRIEDECRAAIGRAVEEVESAAPRPPVESLVEDVYSFVPPHLKEQLGWLTRDRDNPKPS